MPSRDRLASSRTASFRPRKESLRRPTARECAGLPPFNALKALTSGAGGTEGREPGTRAHGHALWRQIKGLVENNRRDHRARNSLSRHMAKTMTPMPGSLRLRRLGGGARGGCDRHRMRGLGLPPPAKAGRS